MSAVAIFEALDQAGFQVVPVGIDRDGAWWLTETAHRPFRAEGRSVVLEVPRGVLSSSDDEIGFDVVFPVLHGPYGEDGTIQGAFEMMGTPYVGCGVKSSAMAIDKDISKRIFREAGIPTNRFRIVRDDEVSAGPRIVDDIIDDLGLPVFIKPAELGSSVGVNRATTDAQLKDGLEEAFEYGPKAIIEEAVRGREIEVAVLDGPRVSLPGEVVLPGGWYTYDAKYNDDSSRFVVPAELTESEVETVGRHAATAFEAMECRGLARIDFFLETPGRGFLINEVNTMPGFTPISGFPKMWEASGIPYPELCAELVELALRP